MSFISHQLIDWHKIAGRHNLPWQNTKDPYLVWLSEIMLQQTQVNTVLPYYKKFIKQFPSIDKLALTNEERVLELWSGLGYYRRARNLHKTAVIISKNFDGKFPSSFEDILLLPGIGRSTAGAISSIAFRERKPILDGNVKRVFTRYFGITEWPGKLSIEKKLWDLAESNLPASSKNIHTYTQALMDLGSTVCKRTQPLCDECPLKKQCISYEKDLIHEIPVSKKKKSLPTKEIFVLAINSNNHFLLTKRATNSVWPGLWSMPEVKDFQDTSKWLSKNLQIKKFQIIQDGKHKTAFTHYKLNIHFQYISVLSPNQGKIEKCKWIEKKDLNKTALPTPINKILSFLK